MEKLSSRPGGNLPLITHTGGYQIKPGTGGKVPQEEMTNDQARLTNLVGGLL
ncbi:MAG TPA: hypothetical protein VFE46_17720 [Pirellulales bacterium]|jgi:hypothetical protein|nr:hypothetical protein [Pirellulales bacterium]